MKTEVQGNGLEVTVMVGLETNAIRFGVAAELMVGGKGKESQ